MKNRKELLNEIGKVSNEIVKSGGNKANIILVPCDPRVPLSKTKTELEKAFAILVHVDMGLDFDAMKKYVKEAAILDQNLQVAIEYLRLALDTIYKIGECRGTKQRRDVKAFKEPKGGR